MFRKLGVLIAVTLVLGVAMPAGAVTFSPSPTDLKDLDHYYYYMWGINWTVPGGEKITSAKLTFFNIYDWKVEDDLLSVYLLDNINPDGWTNIGTNTWQKGDNQNTSVPTWPVPNTFIGSWTDPAGGTATGFNKVFEFNQAQITALETYSSNNGVFGFGIDPDCHYYNSGVQLEITTTPVPEPNSLILLGSGLMVLWAAGRKLF